MRVIFSRSQPTFVSSPKSLFSLSTRRTRPSPPSRTMPSTEPRSSSREIPRQLMGADPMRLDDTKRDEENAGSRLQCHIMSNIVLGLGISLDGYTARPASAVELF